MSSIIMSEEFLAKAKTAESFEELKSIVSVEGVEVADAELMDAWERVSQSAGKKKFKLSEEELDNVAGGCGEDDPNSSENQPINLTNTEEGTVSLGNEDNLITGTERR